MIPTYKRPGRIFGAIESFRAHCPDRHQVVVRFSDADPTADEQSRVIQDKYRNCVCIIGPHRRGYRDINQAYEEMIPLCSGEWLNIWDDDMQIEGTWVHGLESAPKQSLVVCESYTLGQSVYGPGSLDEPATGWFMHRESWLAAGGGAMTFPPDTYGRDFADARGWTVHRLPGTRLVHDWQRPIDGDR